MSTHGLSQSRPARNGETVCYACGGAFPTEPGPPICGGCFTRPGRLASLMAGLETEERAALVALWEKAAETLEATAAAYRLEGDPEYAAELEASAGDYRTAAEQVA